MRGTQFLLLRDTEKKHMVRLMMSSLEISMRDLHTFRNLEEKKAQVIASIEEQENFTEELKAQIEQAQTQVVCR